MDKSNSPATGTDDLRMSTNVFGLEQLFYLPLKAVIDANTEAALEAIKIIRKYGFDNDKSSKNYGQLKMATFSYNYVGKSGQLETMSISIPFITLIPLPLLEVKHAEIDFALSVIGQLDIDVDVDSKTASDKKMMAIFAPNSGENAMNLSLEANMNVNILVGQSDLPGGIIQLLNLGQEATMGDNLFELSSKPSTLLFKANSEISLEVSYAVREDLPGDIIFDVSVEPSFETPEPPFIQPIEILQGNLYGQASWNQIKVIPIRDEKMAIFKLRFSAGDETSNGFIMITSNYSKLLKIYFAIS